MQLEQDFSRKKGHKRLITHFMQGYGYQGKDGGLSPVS